MHGKVLVPIADGTEELEAVTIIDILRRAGATVVVAGVGGQEVTASRGTRLIADDILAKCKDDTYELIVLPGGIPGAEHLRDCVELVTLLKAQNREGKMIGAICAAPQVILAHHGILGERRATGHPAYCKGISNQDALEQRVVVEDNLITSRGAGSALEFSLTLVQLLFGRKKAVEVADAIVTAPGALDFVL